MCSQAEDGGPSAPAETMNGSADCQTMKRLLSLAVLAVLSKKIPGAANF